MITNESQARHEALARKADQDGLNGLGEGCEFAYSPSTFAVGMRNIEEAEGSIFRVFNTGYPMYGRNTEVTDWVSIGVSKPGLAPRQEDQPGTHAGYCVQCREAVTGKIGDFVYLRGVCVPMVAISPIFSSLADLFPWMKKNRWQHVAGTNFDCIKLGESVD